MKDNKDKGLLRQMSDSFVNGLIVVVPPAITAAVVVWLLNLTEGTVGKYLPVDFPGAGLLTIIIAIWMIGVLSGNALSRRVIKFFEWLLDKIPIVKFIYSSVKQVSTAVFESDSMFKSVVLVPFHQSLALGFLMSNIPEPIKRKLGDEYVCVFVPWSLNMTSGTNLIVRKSDVINVDMRPEDALQYMLTAGTIAKKG